MDKPMELNRKENTYHKSLYANKQEKIYFATDMQILPLSVDFMYILLSKHYKKVKDF